MGVYTKNLGCSSTNAVVNLKFIMVQMHLNASDYPLKLNVSRLPQLPYTTTCSLTLNLRTFSKIQP